MSIKQIISSLGELVTETDDLEDQLSHTSQELNDLYHMVETTPNNMELGKRVRQYYWDNTEPTVSDEPVYIYESPDGGETVYRRKIGDYDTPREQVDKDGNPLSEQLDLFPLKA